MRADAARNRARILAAATEVFAAQGSSASTEEVATRAGVAIGTVFRHFPTKNDLLTAIMKDLLNTLVADIGALTDRALPAAPPIGPAGSPVGPAGSPVGPASSHVGADDSAVGAGGSRDELVGSPVGADASVGRGRGATGGAEPAHAPADGAVDGAESAGVAADGATGGVEPAHARPAGALGRTGLTRARVDGAVADAPGGGVAGVRGNSPHPGGGRSSGTGATPSTKEKPLLFVFFERLVAQAAARKAVVDLLAAGGTEIRLPDTLQVFEDAVGRLLRQGQAAGTVSAGVALPEVMALLTSASQGAVQGGWSPTLQERILAVVFAGLARDERPSP